MANKSTEVALTLRNMSLGEMLEKNIDYSSEAPIHPTDRLFMEDTAFMAMLNKRKSQSNVTKLQNEIKEILQ